MSSPVFDFRVSVSVYLFDLSFTGFPPFSFHCIHRKFIIQAAQKKKKTKKITLLVSLFLDQEVHKQKKNNYFHGVKLLGFNLLKS